MYIVFTGYITGYMEEGLAKIDVRYLCEWF